MLPYHKFENRLLDDGFIRQANSVLPNDTTYNRDSIFVELTPSQGTWYIGCSDVYSNEGFLVDGDLSRFELALREAAEFANKE